MAEYAIGDVQGCFAPLLHLLSKVSFDPHQDRLWFVGDLVNRGPDSLAVLRFVKALPVTPRITLGNHDLYFLSRLFANHPKKAGDDTLDELLAADDCYELGHWLRTQSLLYYDKNLHVVMTHAGIAPIWDLNEACAYAKELETILSGDQFITFLTHMYGNSPTVFTEHMDDMAKLRLICNYFTRMRFCDQSGQLVYHYKGTIDQAPAGIYPWFSLEKQKAIDAEVVFGHWAALQGKCSKPHFHAIDTGCLWGNQLTALRLNDMQRVSVPGLS